MNMRTLLVAATVMIGAVSVASTASAQNAPASAPPMSSNASGYTPRQSIYPNIRLNNREGFFPIYATAVPAQTGDLYAQAVSFAQCATKVSPDLSERLLAASPESSRASGLSRQLRGISKGCVPAGTYVPATFLRGAVAETLYVRGAGDLAAGAALSERPKTAESLAGCLFVQSPTAVDGLLRTAPGTAAEKTALSRLAGFAPNCIVAGRRVSISAVAPFLRAELAEVAYEQGRLHD